jgi:hypothetical protein
MRRVSVPAAKVQLLYSTSNTDAHTKVVFAHDTFHAAADIESTRALQQRKTREIHNACI